MKPRLLPMFSVVFIATVLAVFLYQGVHEHTIAPIEESHVQSGKRNSPDENPTETTFAHETHKGFR